MVGSWRPVVSAVLAAGALLAATGEVRAQRDDQRVTYYGVEFPAEFADGQRISTRDYERTNPGLGFSAGYRHRGATSTCYIYDAGLRSIPDDLRAAVVVQQFEQARNDIRNRVRSEGSTVSSTGTFAITDANGRQRLICEGFYVKRSGAGAPLDTYLCLGVTNGKFFKVRTTMPQRTDSQTEVRRFIGAWAAKLWKS